MRDVGLTTKGEGLAVEAVAVGDGGAGYGSLYRKMRPQTFADIIGQRHAVEALKRQVATGNIAHAYLFSGSRGTGKTSTALVFARAINCLNPQDGEPCMACENCLGASGVDVVEMDAASYNSVDDIRQLREYVKYAPAHGKKKVYIIDEVHMLSNAAFNALLKTLEEPPTHIVFILATTELHMIPATVQSRCQRYDFRRVSKDGMRAKILEVAGRFGVEIEAAAVDLIIRVADGSMRDTLALLEQALSLERPRLTESEAAEIFGVARTGELVEIVRGALLGEVDALVARLESLFGEGVDAFELLTGLISTLRDVLVQCIVRDAARGDTAARALVGDDYLAAVCDISGRTSVSDAEFLFNKMVELSKFARYSKNKESIIEVTLLVFAAARRDGAAHAKAEAIAAVREAPKVSEEEKPSDAQSETVAAVREAPKVSEEEKPPDALPMRESGVSDSVIPEQGAVAAPEKTETPGAGEPAAASKIIVPAMAAAPEKATITYVPKTQKAEDGERRSPEELKKIWSDILSHIPDSKKTLLKNSEIALFVGGELLVHIRGLSQAREMVIERSVKADVVDAAKLVTGRDCMVKFEAVEKSSIENAEDVVNVKKYFEEKDIDIEIV